MSNVERNLKRKVDSHQKEATKQRTKIIEMIVEATGDSSNTAQTLPHSLNFETVLSPEQLLQTFHALDFRFNTGLTVDRALSLWWLGSVVQRQPPLYLVRRSALHASQRKTYVVCAIGACLATQCYVLGV